MPTSTNRVRLQEFDACFNFRDLGGYRTLDGATVRWATVYRADTLHRLSESDVERFGSLAISTIVDLRSPEEIADFGRVPDAVDGPDWHHEPIIESLVLRAGERQVPAGEEALERPPGESYFEFLGDGARAVNVLRLVTHASGASVFHCTAGKDRTGVIAAMIFDLIGVPDETIVEDYVLTEATRERSTAWIAEHEPQLAALFDEIPPERRRIDPQAIIGFLDRLRDAHGSVEELVRSRGMTEQELHKLRAKLLET